MREFSPVEVAHRFVRSCLGEGDFCVDATLGNGQDTVLLANQVGETGRVLGFDVQLQAINNTRSRLVTSGLDDRVDLLHQGHEELGQVLHSKGWKALNLIMFNLGYLPGSDKSTVTQAGSTLTALDAAIEWLAENGAISIVAYRGHPGGVEEYNAVLNWMAKVPSDSFFTFCYERSSLSRKNNPVFFWVSRR